MTMQFHCGYSFNTRMTLRFLNYVSPKIRNREGEEDPK